jgi:hypothetical protein
LAMSTMGPSKGTKEEEGGGGKRARWILSGTNCPRNHRTIIFFALGRQQPPTVCVFERRAGQVDGCVVLPTPASRKAPSLSYSYSLSRSAFVKRGLDVWKPLTMAPDVWKPLTLAPDDWKVGSFFGDVGGGGEAWATWSTSCVAMGCDAALPSGSTCGPHRKGRTRWDL